MIQVHELTPEEYEYLVDNVKEDIWVELKNTIPSSIDIMRDLRFRDAAKRSVDTVLDRIIINR